MKTRRKFIIDSSLAVIGLMLTPIISCEKIPLRPLTYMTGSVTGSVTGSYTSSLSGSNPWNPDYNEYTGSIKL